MHKGANVATPDQIGMSSLALAAIMPKKMRVEHLIRKGAEVNHKKHHGNTPIHFCIESGDVEIVKLLVDAGAMNSPNEIGLMPDIMACCFGHENVMKFLDSMFPIEIKQLYDCYCLLTANEIMEDNFIQAEIYMKKYLGIGLTDVTIFHTLCQANPIYDNLQEPTNMDELDYILSGETRMFFISSIYCERILGIAHYNTAFCVRITGDAVLTDKRYKCIDVWYRSLNFYNNAHFYEKETL